MDSTNVPQTNICHLVVLSFPGQSHINPMMNLCKLLISRNHDILITFVVTEECLTYIGSDPKPDNICFRTILNVPLERRKAEDFSLSAIIIETEDVMTKMEAPFEQLLDQLEPPVTAIICDIEVPWSISLGDRRNLPMAAVWTMSVSFFSTIYHFGQFSKDGHFFDMLEYADDIPGISLSNIADLKTVFHRDGQRILRGVLDCVSRVSKAQYLLFTSVYELEAQVINTLRSTFPFPVYAIGPAIPYLELQNNSSRTNNCDNIPDYIQWLDYQPANSVLYISFGSFLYVSSTQMDEILAGLQISGARFILVARGEASRLNQMCGDTGLVLSWCDQLRVLCHSSVGGFWTHCGWNSTLESVFAGVPMLTFPLFLDQDPNRNQIVEDWKIGKNVNREIGTKHLLTRKEIAELVQSFMDLDSNEGKEMRRKARQLKDMCRGSTTEGGSSVINLDAFISNILQGQCH